MQERNQPVEVPADFGGLVYAPSCEQEVVALFFLMLPHLGRRFVVDGVGKDFPDWEMRELNAAGERVPKTVEFELDGSSYFTQHEEKGQTCDVVICWKSSRPPRPGQPPEILELAKLPDIGRFVLYPEKSRRPETAQTIEDFKAACRAEGLDFHLRLVGFLEGLAARFPRIAELVGGRGKEPCRKFQVRNPATGGVANPLGAENPRKVYAEWGPGTAAELDKAYPDLRTSNKTIKA